ncbi:hypothetical protein [Flammeovirga agarivorans]|uniref:STAS domain-containing protein n=1 Tax=Flammeovirga agarivorans TaxID=2726742 RepID=A0A7X8SNX5_9BACT|nr:hypothetical protein [Flammeovirga agarivorans]NLR93610.1 hypothetical protein [Flammeovirga agarivorans]
MMTISQNSSNAILSVHANNVQLKLEGFISQTFIADAMIKAANVMKNNNINTIIINTEDLSCPLSIPDKYQLISMLKTFGFERCNEIFTVCGLDQEERDLVETMALNRGWKLTALQSQNELINLV